MNKSKVYHLIIFLSVSIFWLILPIKYLIHFTSDDTYFYLKVAYNLATGKGSSFDGINLTNGYHPLWLFVLSIYFFFIKFISNYNPEGLLRLTFILSTIINCLSIYILIKIIKQLNIIKSNYSKIGFLFLSISFNFFYLIGTEQNLLIFLFLLYLYAMINDADGLKNYSRLKIIVPSLLFLTRIDLGLILGITLIIFEFQETTDKKILWSLLIIIITVLLYSLSNFIFFGTYSSVSSLYKFNINILENLKFFPTPLSNPIDFSLLLIFILNGVIYWFDRRTNKSNAARIFEMMYFVSALFLIFHFLFNRLGTREWYYIFPIFISLILLFIYIERKKLERLAFYLSGIIMIIYFTIFRINYYNHNSAYDFAKRIKEIVNMDEKVFQIDYSGLVGFFSERTIINGDGLMNNFEYYIILREGKLFEYLRRLNPDYLIFYSFDRIDKGDSISYNFYLFRDYKMVFHKNRIKLKSEFVYGGLFRKKYGNFYLISLKDYFLNE